MSDKYCGSGRHAHGAFLDALRKGNHIQYMTDTTGITIEYCKCDKGS